LPEQPSTPDVVTSNPRYEMVVHDSWNDTWRIKDTKTGAITINAKFKGLMEDYLRRLNNGVYKFHDFGWWMPNGTRVARRA